MESLSLFHLTPLSVYCGSPGSKFPIVQNHSETNKKVWIQGDNIKYPGILVLKEPPADRKEDQRPLFQNRLPKDNSLNEKNWGAWIREYWNLKTVILFKNSIKLSQSYVVYLVRIHTVLIAPNPKFPLGPIWRLTPVPSQVSRSVSSTHKGGWPPSEDMSQKSQS